MSKYEFTDDMREISGFAGGYEAACRRMVVAGLEWFDDHTDADPQFKEYNGVYGLIVENNEAAEALSAAVVAPVPDCSGAMHQAAISHIFTIKKMGWESYCKLMREKKIQEQERAST